MVGGIVMSSDKCDGVDKEITECTENQVWYFTKYYFAFNFKAKSVVNIHLA